MNAFISFYATRASSDSGQQPKMQPRKFVEAARQSLVNVRGLVYPNLQSSIMWTDFHHDENSLVFTFDRRPPFGDLRIEADGSYMSTRRPIDEEEGPFIFLESLTWEFTFNVLFFQRFISSIRQKGKFRIGVSLGGFDNGHVDWSGFDETSAAASRGTLVNWRFRPSKTVASFEEAVDSFPIAEDGFPTEEIVNVIAELSFVVVGVRHSPLEGTLTSRLELDRKSITKVVKQALQQEQ